MKRRDFLKISGLLSVPLFLGGQNMLAFGDEAGNNDAFGNKLRKLILIQLDGGNDGLNTLIPMDQYANLVQARPNIIIPEKKLLPLAGNSALHPSLSEIRRLYSNQNIMFIQGVGYPNPNLSHFRSKEIVLTASDSNDSLSSGWMGRLFQDTHSAFPENYPSKQYPHPLALSIGSVSSPSCQGNTANYSSVIRNLNTSYSANYGGSVANSNSYYGEQISYITSLMEQTEKYLGVVSDAASNAENKSDKYPKEGENPLADKLKVVARLIAGGLQTQVYVINLGGFDTHADQVDPTDTTQGNHAYLLRLVSQAVDAFQDDISQLGHQDQVLGLVYSEFGRRIKSNQSDGTDHGTSWPAILFGSQINPKIYGDSPEIPSDAGKKDNLAMQHDFRSVYASILSQWFEVDNANIDNVLGGEFEQIPILKTANANDEIRAEFNGFKAFPSVFKNNINTRFKTNGGNVHIYCIDAQGRIVKDLFHGVLPSGEHQMIFDLSNLTSGIIHLVLFNGKQKMKQTLIKQG